VTPTFQGEVQFLGWNDDHARGATVKFQLADDAELDAFRRMTVRKGKQAGQRLAMVLVGIADDETPAVTEELAAQGSAARAGPLCLLAAQWCREPKFQKWCEAENEEEAAGFVRSFCGVTSRRQIDDSAPARWKFLSGIRTPYMEYTQG
jgi:hypothetical protein